jgi:two-component system chemotaxis response regulator CheB
VSAALDGLTKNIDAIVIGASAGGVEILSMLLAALPANCPASFFIVMHIPRERPSLLADVFKVRCALPVKEAEDKEPVQPGTVYLAPPDYHLLIDRGPALALSSDEPVHFSRPSIDVLFESAADIYGERLVGLILTGANQDGAAGLAAVGRAGGRTVVQDPDTAAVAYLPQSALLEGPVDFVLTPPLLRGVFAAWGARE